MTIIENYTLSICKIRNQNNLSSLPLFSLISFAAAGVSGVCSTLGVLTVSSSLPLPFGKTFVFGLVPFFLFAGSDAGVLGVESLSFVFGVFGRYILLVDCPAY